VRPGQRDDDDPRSVKPPLVPVESLQLAPFRVEAFL